ncbi:CMD domain protein [Saxibacter everestensis]|uniref:CMD domain protein n=1 Tax=Saxibacter everestensis TaxID=2909229 RepID=A0ABY8QT56_9MICO|nr:CMD domain protein [Brevibacteriaceae bacterium ZFBP1038]
MTGTPDIIDALAGITPGSVLDELRAHRLDVRDNAQQSYLALFEPDDDAGFSIPERFLIAAFVVGLHGESAASEFYRAELGARATAETTEAIGSEIDRGSTSGPYGTYREPGLAQESRPGPAFRISDPGRQTFGDRISAGLEHAHHLVFHPRDSRPELLDQLLRAGWTTTQIVTLSQEVAFLTFQIRVVHGLRQLADKRKVSAV